MSKQDESYLDSLLDSISVNKTQERPAATKKSKKNIEKTAEEETVVAEPETRVETVGLDSLDDLDDFDVPLFFFSLDLLVLDFLPILTITFSSLLLPLLDL